MTILPLLGALAIAAVEITVSPDQPLPFSYVDDPLIVEIRSSETTRADITIGLEPEGGGAPVQQVFPAVALGAEIKRWCAMKEIPALRGPWKVSVEVRAENGESYHEAEVYRVDRPAGAYVHPLYAFGDALDRAALLALRGVGVNLVRVPVAHGELGLLLEEVERLGMKAIVALGEDPAADSAAAPLAASHCAAIERWELSATRANAAALRETATRLQALPCNVPVSLAIREPEAVTEILGALALPGIQHVVVAESPKGPTALDGVRDEMAALGIEAPALEYLHETGGADAFPPVLFDALAHRARRVGFPAALVLEAGELGRGLAYLNGLAHGVPPAPYAGTLPQPGASRALLFSNGIRWTLAFWGDGGEVRVPWSGEHAFVQLDSWNNTTPVSPPDGEQWRTAAGTGVQFLRGENGPVLKATILSQTRAEVKHLLAQRLLEPAWDPEVRAALEAVAADPENEQSRTHFFTLLRTFPRIEERWHTGGLPRPVAVAALAHLADLARTLCRLEAARDAAFLEPLPDTLARCEEYQSLYLTGAITTPQARARGDWLVDEVQRLADEAELLAASGAKIEAGAVAALAEWRARALEFAAKAGPLSDQMALPKAAEPEPVAEEPEPKKPAATKKAPAKKPATKKR